MSETDLGTQESEAADTAGPSGEPSVLKIGFAYPDVSAFAILSDDLSIGDPELQAEAVVNHWRTSGLLPPGVDVELVFSPYEVVGETGKLASCTQLAQDEDVFAVVAGTNFAVGAQCLTSRFAIPTIDTDGVSSQQYELGAPWWFSLRTNRETQFRNFAQWAIDAGLVDGKRIGLYYETPFESSVQALRDQFRAAGHEIVAEVTSSGEGIGSPADTLAPQRFLAEDVDVVLPIVGSGSSNNMFAAMRDQNYQPQILDLDIYEHTTDLVAKGYPTEIYDNTPAMTFTRVGQLGSGVESPQIERCLEIYETYTSSQIPRSGPESGELASILRTCDLLDIVLAGINGMAGDSSKEAFVRAIEQAGVFGFASSADGSFSADDHSGSDEFRTIQWDATCECWEATTDFRPMVRG